MNIFFMKMILMVHNCNWLLDLIDQNDTKKAYVSEAVEKIPNKNKKHRKRSS